jgi:Ca-activated chloride channel family protein
MSALVVALTPVAIGVSTASADQTGPSSMVLVLDASGSMNEPDGHGSTKIAAAKAAVKTIVGQLPTDLKVGLMVYGHRVPSQPDHAKACKDVELVAPVAPLDKAALTAAVDRFAAKGETPIGTSLQQAAAALPAGAAGSIVLVSDGEDSCAPPAPCDVAKQLKASGVQLTVDTVGLKVGAKAKSELTCIAQSTGGTYTDVQDSAKLTDSLGTAVSRSRRATGGTKVEGGASPAQAPTLTTGGYEDTIVTGEQLFYAVKLDAGQKASGAGTFNASQIDFDPVVKVQWFNDAGAIDSYDFKNGFAGATGTVGQSIGPIGGKSPQYTQLDPGTYYFSVSFEAPGDGTKATMPFSLTLKVTGAGGSAVSASPSATDGASASSSAGAGAGSSTPINARPASSDGYSLPVVIAAGLGGVVVGGLIGWITGASSGRRKGSGRRAGPPADGRGGPGGPDGYRTLPDHGPYAQTPMHQVPMQPPAPYPPTPHRRP